MWLLQRIHSPCPPGAEPSRPQVLLVSPYSRRRPSGLAGGGGGGAGSGSLGGRRPRRAARRSRPGGGGRRGGVVAGEGDPHRSAHPHAVARRGALRRPRRRAARRRWSRSDAAQPQPRRLQHGSAWSRVPPVALGARSSGPRAQRQHHDPRHRHRRARAGPSPAASPPPCALAPCAAAPGSPSAAAARWPRPCPAPLIPGTRRRSGPVAQEDATACRAPPPARPAAPA